MNLYVLLRDGACATSAVAVAVTVPDPNDPQPIRLLPGIELPEVQPRPDGPLGPEVPALPGAPSTPDPELQPA